MNTTLFCKINERMRVLFVLRKSKVNHQGLSTILCRVTINGDRSNSFSTKVMAAESKWDQKNQRVIGNSGSAVDANNKLAAIKSELQKIFTELTVKKKHFTPEDVKNYHTGSNTLNVTVTQLGQKHIEILTSKSRSPRTTERYARNYKYLVEYLGGERAADSVTQADVNDFWLHLNKYGYSHDYCNKIVQACNGLFIFGERRGEITRNPFKSVQLEWRANYDLTFLDEAELKLIQSKKWSSERLEKTADMFLFMCYSGLHISDYLQLTSQHIVEKNGAEWINLMRTKTKVKAIIPLHNETRRLIEKYGGVNNLPKLSAAKCNEYLKNIGDILGFSKNLTNKLGRKTFANLCINYYNMSFESVSKMLGHKDTRYLLHYGNVTENRILSEWKGK